MKIEDGSTQPSSHADEVSRNMVARSLASSTVALESRAAGGVPRLLLARVDTGTCKSTNFLRNEQVHMDVMLPIGY